MWRQTDGWIYFQVRNKIIQRQCWKFALDSIETFTMNSQGGTSNLEELSCRLFQWFFPFLIGVGKRVSDTERDGALRCSVEEAERPCWQSNAPLSDGRHEVKGGDGRRWVMCHVMQREVIMSLVLAFHFPDDSTPSVPSAALIVLRLQYQWLSGWQPFLSPLGCLCE